MKLRSRFSKKGDLIFISHLDVVRLFERAMRRGKIPISYTQGFNPHPIMAFATALGVGVESEAEYIDIQVDEKIETDEFISRLNAVMPGGLKILMSQYIDSSEDSLMAILRRSIYLVKINLEKTFDEEAIKEKINHFLTLEEIIEVKEKKKKKGKGFRRDKNKVQETNIRPLIHDLSLFSMNGQELILKMNLTTGSSGNLKPEVLVRKLAEETDLPIILDTVRINRLELLKEKDGQYVTLIEG
ncbi:TIGR03936 family radical SAM-associated protein [Alkaliphilus hydrothermalis]|uniref:Radical SAM-linked protein n=1 Tax=Alkaliphilus hydrothermalis TaxID=1482730 RepID=A0ABS2NKX3_9FIRM|nr:TIGR03936 family radical SAM-associated protein [Alkaliphilus hydrothermalis]MBM7613589.1 radical SAM-linked protein [Alkaliphilus hydrothermalis]